jgi:hypothetical protein
LHQKLRGRERRYLGNHRLACGTTRQVEYRWQRSEISRARGSQVESPNIGRFKSRGREVAKARTGVSESRHIGTRELENRVLGVASSEVTIVRGCDKAEVPRKREKVSVDQTIGSRGSVRTGDHDGASVDFPMGKLSIRARKHVGEYLIGVRGFVRPDLVSSGLAVL